MNKPIVGITMGDPAGSGPEITIKALADPEQYSYCRPIVVGDVKVMEQAKKFVGREDIVIHRCEKVSDALFTPGTIDVLHLDLIEDISKFEIAKVSVEGGNAAFQCVKKVIELAMAGEVDATCTNALNKEAIAKSVLNGQGFPAFSPIQMNAYGGNKAADIRNVPDLMLSHCLSLLKDQARRAARRWLRRCSSLSSPVSFRHAGNAL